LVAFIPILDKYFGGIVFLLLAVMGATQFASALGESQTADEAAHLSAGYSYLKTGDFRINYQHPPLGKYINALPMLLLQPRLPVDDPSWDEADAYAFGKAFLYSNTTPADTLLLYGRIPTILLTLCLGLILALWTRSQFGAPAALLALLLYSFDPNIIAHGRYITSDLMVTLAIFVSCLAWREYLVRRTPGSLVRAGILLGLALLMKASAVILLPIFALLYLLCWHGGKGRPCSFRELVQALAACCALGFVVVYAGYGFETRTALSDRALARRFEMASEQLQSDPHVSPLLRRLLDPATAIGKITHAVAKYAPIPAYSYLSGVYWQADKNRQGHDSYLLGGHSEKGWWYYFPVAFAVKSPVGVILLLALCLVWAARNASGWLRAPLNWHVLTVPPAIYLAATMTSNINIGIRHLLPIYPFLYAALAAWLMGLKSGRLKFACAAVISVLVCAESISAYPFYLPFFNAAAGGGAQGPRYLIDSNVDWGQDLKRLKSYQAAHGGREICLSYFGHIDPAYYAIQSRPLTDAAKQDSCDLAISVNSLYSDDQFAWLRKLTPDARIGYSIYYYDRQKLPIP
jgi:4-amino-4-deoxy-L-arabinose transferase-like glycosyltransferase